MYGNIMKKLFIIISCCVFIINGGCSQKNQNETDYIYHSDNTWLADTISISEAVKVLSEKTDNGDPNRHFICENIDFYNDKCYYIFRCYNDFTDHRATVGWYAVDVLTGECFDTVTLTDLVLIS